MPLESSEPYYDLVIPFNNPSEILNFIILKWGDMKLLPIYDSDDDTGNRQRITRMHEMIVWTSGIILPLFKPRFELFGVGLNQMLNNYGYTSTTSGSKEGTGNTTKTGGESFTHGEQIATTQSGPTITTYRTSTGENASPRFDREVEVTDSDPTVTHSGTDYRGYSDANGNPYSEDKTNEETSSSSTEMTGYKIGSLPDEYLKMLKLKSRKLFEEWLYELITAISTGVYR